MSRKMDKYGGAQQRDYGEGSRADFSAAVDSLASIFGEVMERDALFAIVESCNGDESLAAQALLDIMGQNQPQVADHEQPQCSSSQATSSTHHQPQAVNPPNQQQSLSYRNVTMAPGRSNNQTSIPIQANNVPAKIWSEDLKRIFYYHNKGYRTLIMLRGLPGSGKSYLAKEIIEMTVGPGPDIYKDHVFSSDDFFYVNGTYIHNKQKLGDAHEWNQRRVRYILQNGTSPVIVDNTNVKYWEMECYARAGVQEGYYIEILEPQTKWAWQPNQLVKRNRHNVPYQTIQRMYEKYDSNISGPEYIRRFNLNYPRNKQPPMLRLIPKIENDEVPKHTQVATNQDEVSAEQSKQIANVPSSECEIVGVDVAYKDDSASGESDEGVNLEKYAIVAKKLEEFEQIDNEWEKGENWDDQDSQSAVKKSPQKVPKPQRNREKEQLFPTVIDCQDWLALTPAWTQDIPTITETESSPVETRESCTCIEFGDTDHYDSQYKVLTGTPRDINFYYMPPMNKTHKDNMYDKSTTSCDLDIIKEKSEKRLFQQFRRMFKGVPRCDLRDIFDKCGGDVSWAVELVIGGVHQSENLDDYQSSDSEADEKECEDPIAPSNVVQTAQENVAESNPETKEAVPQLLTPKRIKKDKTISESSLQLKRQIEKNIVIPDKFYADHTVKLRKGVLNTGQANNPAGEGPSKAIPSDSSSSEKESSDGESSKTEDTNITFNLGREFVQNLNKIFDRESEECNWEHIMPMITMPMSILNHINALWMQSLAYQVESQLAYTDLMVKQDKEFAWQLAAEEDEINRTGQEPKVPDFKEIMEMDLAHTLCQKEWKKGVPNDWASKMTLEKLVNLFPDIAEEVLCEMLMAHDNCFQATVETLLMSTGQSSVLEQDNGVNKFVMEKEVERQAKIIEQKKKQLERETTEWPLITELDKVDMETVESFRQSADKNLALRNDYMHKAQHYIRQKMLVPAGIAFDMALYHKRQYEQDNCKAVSALILVNHANNNDKNTLDLHYMHVSEALQILDVYIDHHIVILRDQQKQERRVLKTCDLFLITGRGLHSQGRGPRIKPAVRRRLKQRGFRVYELNPGLLSIKLTKDCQITNQMLK